MNESPSDASMTTWRLFERILSGDAETLDTEVTQPYMSWVVALGATVGFIFGFVLCLRVLGPRRGPPSEFRNNLARFLPPPPEEVDLEKRKEFLSRTLVIKHVVGIDGFNNKSSTEESNTSSPEDPPASISTSCSCHHNTDCRPAYRHLKGDLVLSQDPPTDDADDCSTDIPMCAICTMYFEVGDQICWSHNDDCNHVFHHECIEAWLLAHEDCPCCRHNFLNTKDESGLKKEESMENDETLGNPNGSLRPARTESMGTDDFSNAMSSSSSASISDRDSQNADSQDADAEDAEAQGNAMSSSSSTSISDKDSQNADSQDADSEDVEAHDADLEDVEAQNVEAPDAEAQDVEARDIEAQDIEARDIETQGMGEDFELHDVEKQGEVKV